MSDNWIVGNLQSAFETWNGKISEIWSLITTTPQAFHGGAIWTTIVTINEALKAVGYGLLVLFFAMSVFQSAVSFRDFQRPEFVLRHFIRFLLAKLARRLRDGHYDGHFLRVRERGTDRDEQHRRYGLGQCQRPPGDR